MKKIINWFSSSKSIFPLLLLSIMVILLVCLIIRQEVVNRKLRTTIGVMTVDAQSFSVMHNNDSSTIYQQTQLLFTKDQIISKLKLDTAAKGLKHITSAIKATETVSINRVSIPRIDTVYYPPAVLPHDSSDGYSCLDSFSLHNAYLSMQFHIDSAQDLILDNGELTNIQTIIVANKKMGFLRTPKPIVQITNSNPYFKFNSIQNGQVFYSEPFYKKPIVWAILGAVIGGYAVSKF